MCKIYPPIVKDVITLPFYSTYEKLLTITQEDIAYENKKNGIVTEPLTPLEYVLNCAYNN